MDNYKIEKFKWVCMEDSIGCKIGNFQTESNVIMLLKHPNKSVLFKLFHLLSTNPKLISQYPITYTLYSGFDRLQFYVTEILPSQIRIYILSPYPPHSSVHLPPYISADFPQQYPQFDIMLPDDENLLKYVV